MAKKTFTGRDGTPIQYAQRTYALVQPSPDGDDQVLWLTEEELQGILGDRESWGIDQFLPGLPLMPGSGQERIDYINSWPDRTALLMEIRVIDPDVAMTTTE